MTVDELLAGYKKNISFYKKGGITASGGEPLMQSEVHLDIAHTKNDAAAQEMKTLLEEAFPGCGEITIDPLSLSISCHIGEGALGIACSRKLTV